MNATKLLKKIKQQTGENATDAVKALVAEAVRQQDKKDRATYEAVEEAAKAKVMEANDEVARMENDEKRS